jgi:hypothetical protein
MTNLFTNWVMIAAAVVVIGMSIYVMAEFKRKPREEQIEQLREWLLYGCTLAEQKYGSSTGQIKLRYVYDLFTQRFPWMAKIVSFEWFSERVDEALKQMRKMLEENKAIKAIVDGESE